MAAGARIGPGGSGEAKRTLDHPQPNGELRRGHTGE
jgi:hypothetical protein